MQEFFGFNSNKTPVFKSKIITIFVGILLLYNPVNSQQIIQEVENFGTNKAGLKMFTFVPDSLPKKEVPLVVALHGCNQNAKIISEESGWNELAKKHLFIVVYPQQKRSNNIFRN